MIVFSRLHSHLSQIETRLKLQTYFAGFACFATEKKEYQLLHLRTACFAMLAWAAFGAPSWAQSKAEAVLQSFV
jgi:hypothetical protein